MNKHTPGPWETDDIKSCDGHRYVLAGNHEEAQVIARITLRTFVGPTQSESEANARLIAAAPELLESLRLFVGENKTHTEGERMEVARAAIAKATGEQL